MFAIKSNIIFCPNKKIKWRKNKWVGLNCKFARKNVQFGKYLALENHSENVARAKKEVRKSDERRE